jgi:hypothetical protein
MDNLSSNQFMALGHKALRSFASAKRMVWLRRMRTLAMQIKRLACGHMSQHSIHGMIR